MKLKKRTDYEAWKNDRGSLLFSEFKDIVAWARKNPAWRSADEKPTEDGNYLVFREFLSGGGHGLQCCHWHDRDWDLFVSGTVLAWTDLPALPEFEGEPVE